MEVLTLRQKIIRITNEIRISKDGKNTFSNYNYLLPDGLLRVINPLLLKYDVLICFNLHKDNTNLANYHAITSVYDCASGDSVEYSFCIEKPDIKGTNDAQKCGGLLTYAKRYSLMNIFNIASNEDDFDSDNMTAKFKQSEKKSYKAQEVKTEKISEEQAKEIFKIADNNTEIVKEVIKSKGYDKTIDISQKDYPDICSEIKQKLLKNIQTSLDEVAKAGVSVW